MSSSDEYYDSEEEEEELDCMPLDPELEGETLLEVDDEEDATLLGVDEEDSIAGMKAIFDPNAILDFFGIGKSEKEEVAGEGNGTNDAANQTIDEGELQERIMDKVLDAVEDFGFGLFGGANPSEGLFEKVGEESERAPTTTEKDDLPAPDEGEGDGDVTPPPVAGDGDESGNGS